MVMPRALQRLTIARRTATAVESISGTSRMRTISAFGVIRGYQDVVGDRTVGHGGALAIEYPAAAFPLRANSGSQGGVHPHLGDSRAELHLAPGEGAEVALALRLAAEFGDGEAAEDQ